MSARIALMFAGALAAIVVADWLGTFGIRQQRSSDFIRMAFDSVDADNGTPIGDVHIACVRRMQRSACTDQAGKHPGETIITLGVLRRIDKTVLFHHDRGISISNDGPVTLMFIHPDYERYVLQLDDGDVTDDKPPPRIIELRKTAD